VTFQNGPSLEKCIQLFVEWFKVRVCLKVHKIVNLNCLSVFFFIYTIEYEFINVMGGFLVMTIW